MFGWFNALMPREEKFFEMFIKHATIVVAGADALSGLLKGGGDTVDMYCRKIVAHEAEADEVTRQVLTAVRRTFITPFDRTDIQDLTTSLDDAIDQMNKTAKVITLYEIRTFEPQMQAMGDIIVKAAALVLEAMPLLRSIGKNSAKLAELSEQIVRVEDQADRLHDEGRKALFQKTRQMTAGSGTEFIVGLELYSHLEKVVDRFEDVSNEINAIVIDHL